MDAIKRGAAKMGQNHQVYICTFYTSGQITSQYMCQKVEKIDAKLLNQHQQVSRTKRWLHLQRLLCIFFMNSNLCVYFFFALLCSSLECICNGLHFCYLNSL